MKNTEKFRIFNDIPDIMRAWKNFEIFTDRAGFCSIEIITRRYTDPQLLGFRFSNFKVRWIESVRE